MEELLRKSVEITPTGSIHFLNKNEENNSEENKKNNKSCVSFETISRTSTRQSRATSCASSIGHAQVIEDWINKKSLQRIQERHSAESCKTRKLYMTVLNNEETFVQDIEDFIKDHEMLNLRRKELQHKRWHERVYDPLRRQVENTIESEYNFLDAEKRQEYMKYLDHVNKKGDVFLDIIAENEYDPLKLHQPESCMRMQARTPRLSDPLLSQERQRIDEYKTSHRCLTGESLPDSAVNSKWLPSPTLVPLGRHGTHCSKWLAMPLQQIESPDRVRSRKKMNTVFNNTSFNFASWCDLNTGDQATVDTELKLQKKKRFPLPSTFSKEKHWMEFPQDKVLKIAKPHVRFSLPQETVTSQSSSALPPITTQS